MLRIVIRNGDLVVWHEGGHALMPGANLIIQDDRVLEVTRQDVDQADIVIDATGKLVSPGFVNCHVHAGIDTQVLMTDKGAPGYYNSGMLFASASTATMAHSGPAWTDDERRAAGLYPQVELLKSGVTTFLEIGGAIGDMELFGDLVGESGIRCYAGPGFEDATWVLDPDSGAFRYHWDEAAGREGFQRAVAFIESRDGDHDGRLRGAMIPARLDNCTSTLLQDAQAAAESLDVPISVHAAQAGFEYHEMLRRTGRTPIQFMHDLGLLTPRMLLGHCIYVSGHRMTATPPGDDLALIASGGSSVAHSVTVFARRGIAMESWQRYLDAGVRMTFGTDTLPRDFLQEIRLGSYISKVISGDWSAAATRDLYYAATAAGADALGRDDLGRIAPGAKADIFIADLRKLHVGPVVDPILALIHEANASDIETVIVDGKIVIEDGWHTRISEGWLIEQGERVGRKQRAAMSARNWQGKSEEEIFVQTLPRI